MKHTHKNTHKQLFLMRSGPENMGQLPAVIKQKIFDDANASLHLPEKSIRFLNDMISHRVKNNYKGSSSTSSCELSTDAILKMARELLLQGSSIQNLDVASILVGEFFYANSRFISRLSPQKSDDFQLALLFQAAVLKFSTRQFGRANWLLNLCQSSASPSGNALHRIVACFSKVLQERISRELGENGHEFVPEKNSANGIKNLQPEMLKSCQLLPFLQVADLTAIQAMVDNLASARRIHLVDLGIKSGSHLPILMQALAARNESQIELLKLTVVGKSEDSLRGDMLSSFAKSMNIPFEFRLVLSDLKDLSSDMFDLSEDESIAVYSDLHLSSLLPCPEKLLSLLGTIEKLNPCLMVVVEIEASTDTPVFMDRFDAALGFSAAVFDCIEECMKPDHPYRAHVEDKFMWEKVRDTIMCEGEERSCCHERLGFWRGIMSRFGFVEVEFSDTSFCQLDLVAKTNPCWSCCTLEANGKGIVVGWKGSPIKSLSIWKFHHE